MRRIALAIAALLLLTLPSSALGEGAVVFTSARCDQGGVPFGGPGAPDGVCTPSVFVMDDDGSDMTRLTTGGFPGEQHRSGDFDPTWSHDGSQIAFARQTNESFGLIRLFVMRANGSQVRRLLPSSPVDDERGAAWSPKEGLIAFTGRRPNTDRTHIYVTRSDGSGLTRISPDGWMASSPAFTPDGTRVAYFVAHPVPGSFRSHFQVWASDTRGGGRRRLTAGDVPITPNGMSFSPGAKYLTLTFHDGSLYSVRTDGAELTRLTRGIGLGADWSATGDALYYGSGGSANNSVVKRLDFPLLAPPRSLSAPGVNDGAPEWSLPGRVAAAAPVEDETPPLVLLGETIAEPPADVSDPAEGSRRKLAATQLPSVPMSKIPFLVMDRSGIRRIEIAAGLKVKGGCRFLQTSRRLGARRSCGSPTYLRVSDGNAWIKLTSKLPKGRYEARFRTLDYEGNAVRRPKPRIVTVR
jgi:Tol biopolymer transport system component